MERDSTAARPLCPSGGRRRDCHRVINLNGELGGYAGGPPRKRWLLEHERRTVNAPFSNN